MYKIKPNLKIVLKKLSYEKRYLRKLAATKSYRGHLELDQYSANKFSSKLDQIRSLLLNADS